MNHIDAELHVRGRSEYVDDVRPPEGMVHALVFTSAIAHGKILGIHMEAARAATGVLAILTHDDIPGNPMFGPIVQDEILLARDEVRYVGQAIALIVARTREEALKARRLIRVELEPLPVVTDPREAFAAGDLLAPPRTFSHGDVDTAWPSCAWVIEGRCDIGGQEHVPLETNRARAMPREDGHVMVWSSTQSPYGAQKSIARILGIPENHVEVDVKRLGGGFGGKEDQATHWACLAALAATRLQLPVELVLHREEDMRFTGKRHPYSSDFKIGIDADGRILAYEAWHYQNSGAYADLSMPVLERTLLHSTNAYHIPHARVMAVCCRTHLPPNTAFRGFGGPQGMFVVEAAITKAAEISGIPREKIQEASLLTEGDRVYYGQVMERCKARETWNQTLSRFDWTERKQRVTAFNTNNHHAKKGLAVMPICFGISFTKTFLNQGSALLHIYTDGSVGITSGGIEMGQGLSTNLVAIAARSLGIEPTRVKIESTNTTRVANMSPSAASATTDLNGNALLLAIEQVRASLLATAAEFLHCDAASLTILHEKVVKDGIPSTLDWNKLVSLTYMARRRLSAHGFYATPGVHFDGCKGHPFAYHVYGACLVEATVDVLRGTYQIDSACIVHDLGRSINELVDIGQIEGGFAQGLGWMTMEDLVYASDGRLLSGALSTYKLPDVFSMPDDLRVVMLEAEDNPAGPLGSKAVGEPPLMYGIGVYFALRDAIRAVKPHADLPFHAPMTPERTLMHLIT